MNGSSRMLTPRLFFCELKGCYSWLWNCWDALCTPLEKTLAEIWLVDEQAAVCTFRRANRLFDDTWLKYTSGKTNGGLSHGWLRREVIDDSTLRAMQCREVEVKGCCWEDEGRFWGEPMGAGFCLGEAHSIEDEGVDLWVITGLSAIWSRQVGQARLFNGADA